MSQYLGVYSGKLVDPFNLRPSDIDIEDIAHALSLLNRYGGHTKFPYSVAQHSLLLSENVPSELAFAALMHDAVEAYLVDIPYPIKSRLDGYTPLEDGIQAAICRRYGIMLGDIEAVKPFDRRICLDEMRQLCTFQDEELIRTVKPLRVGKIREMFWEDVKDAFLERFYDFYDDGNDSSGPVDLYMGAQLEIFA